MSVFASIMAVISVTIVALNLILVQLAYKIGKWKKLTTSDKAWQRKLAYIAFNYVLPIGIVTTVVLLPLLVLVGLITFVVMLIP